ncbi:hypothetical protein P8452_31019 [Trifolium repens]|nr:hypothetical protein P8452_31019 [Trifolium repens]
MSTCSLQKIFENPPLHAESPTAIIDQSFESWKSQIKPIQHSSSFTEIFGELYFNEITPQPSPSRSPSASYSSFPELINHLNPIPINKPLEVENKNSLSCKRNLSLRLERLKICNKSIDLLENLDKVEDLENKDDKENNDEEEDEEDEDIEEEGEKDSGLEEKWLWNSGRTKGVVNEYPPPISCIGRSGKPCVSFQAYRNNGRFVLKQIPKYDFLHAHREDGRLTLHFVQHDVEDDDDYEEEDEYYDSCSKSNIEEEENCDGVEKERLMES